MADNEDPAEAATRLEAALDRIARLATAPATVSQPTTSADSDGPRIDVPAIAARLDALIAHVRAALAASASS